jgi:hypothetical protein
MKDKKVKRILSGIGTSGSRKDILLKEGEYGRNIMYSCIKMEK